MTVRNIFVFLQQRGQERIFGQQGVNEVPFWEGILLLFHCLLLLPLCVWGGAVFSLEGEDRAGCFTLIVFLM